MNVTITQRIRDCLLERGPASAEHVAEAIPELAAHGGVPRAQLLMRLDPQLERTASNLWAARSTAVSDEQRVGKAAKEYFTKLGRPGTPLSSAVTAIAEATGLEAHRVRELLERSYVVLETNIFNRRRCLASDESGKFQASD